MLLSLGGFVPQGHFVGRKRSKRAMRAVGTLD
jgi:hypothetical protein